MYRNILAKVINKPYILEKSGHPNYANTLHFYNLIVEIKRLGIGLVSGNSELLMKVNFVHKYTDQISSWVGGEWECSHSPWWSWNEILCIFRPCMYYQYCPLNHLMECFNHGDPALFKEELKSVDATAIHIKKETLLKSSNLSSIEWIFPPFLFYFIDSTNKSIILQPIAVQQRSSAKNTVCPMCSKNQPDGARKGWFLFKLMFQR